MPAAKKSTRGKASTSRKKRNGKQAPVQIKNKKLEKTLKKCAKFIEKKTSEKQKIARMKKFPFPPRDWESPVVKKKEPRVLKIYQTSFLKTSGIWRCLNLRSPLHELRFKSIETAQRPMFNLFRLIFHKIHENRVKFLENEVQKMMREGKRPELRRLLELMSDLVMIIEVDGQIYDFRHPPAVDGVEQLLSNSSVGIAIDYEAYVFLEFQRLGETKSVKRMRKLSRGFVEAIVLNFCSAAADLLAFVYDITIGPDNIVQIQGFRDFEIISNHVFYEIGENVEQLAFLHNLTLCKESFLRNTPYDCSFSMIACEESEHLLETVFQFGLLRLLPEGAKEFLNTWILKVRKKIRKQLLNGEFEKEMLEQFAVEGLKTFRIALDDERFKVFLIAKIRKMLNITDFKIFAREWEEYAMQTIRQPEEPLFQSFDKFFAVSEQINSKSRETLSEFFSDSPDQQALLYHTIAQLLQFAINFVVYAIRRVFYRKKNGFKYDGRVDEKFKEFSEFDAYERNPLVRLPMPEDVPMVVVSAPGSFAIIKKERRISKREDVLEMPPPSTPGPSNSKIKELMNSAKKSHKKSFRFEGKEPSEVTEDECAPAEVTDEDVGIPETWQKSYRLILEWNRQLLEQRDRVEARYKMVKAEK